MKISEPLYFFASDLTLSFSLLSATLVHTRCSGMGVVTLPLICDTSRDLHSRTACCTRRAQTDPRPCVYSEVVRQTCFFGGLFSFVIGTSFNPATMNSHFAWTPLFQLLFRGFPGSGEGFGF